MNPITFNDPFLKACAQWDPVREMVGLGDWQASPLFDYETTWEKEREMKKVTEFGEVAEMDWPFETFRLSLAERDIPFDEHDPSKGSETWRQHYVLRRTPNGVASILIRWLPVKNMIAGDLIVFLQFSAREQAAGFSVFDGRRWTHNPEKMYKSMMTVITNSVAIIAAFLLDASLPTTHVAEVFPNQQGRSVQWLKARTHYTLIAHGHPANRNTVTEGQRVAADLSSEISRMAHSRRGHKRTYRHERYTYARGSTRWIRATWCGPKIWQDEGGRQIYKILEPVENQQ